MTNNHNWTPLPTSRERLLAAADIIEAEPDRWNQAEWTTVPNIYHPSQFAGRVEVWLGECGTTCCAAGTGVALTPPDQITANSWSEAGAEAFGLAPDLARAIFAASYRPVSMPRVLRLLATLGEPRTLRAAIIAGLRDLTGAKLTGAYLTGINLIGANLSGANLIWVNLIGANLTNANLTEADLNGADLNGANLDRANLTGANFTDANLVGANLIGINLSRAILTGARISARWLPDGWRLDSNGRAERVTPPQPKLSTISRRLPMTDTITGWRTVATHGQPTDPDFPVLIRTTSDAHVRHYRGADLVQPNTRWIPITELDALPDAPPPPRTVTIEVSADDARDVMNKQWNGGIVTGRIAAAVKAALEADEPEDD